MRTRGTWICDCRSVQRRIGYRTEDEVGEQGPEAEAVLYSAPSAIWLELFSRCRNYHHPCDLLDPYQEKECPSHCHPLDCSAPLPRLSPSSCPT